MEPLHKTSLGRAVWVCLFAATLAPAQFRNLATTADGSRAFFISPLRQTGTDQHLYTKIFAVDSSGVSLVLQPPPPGPDSFGNFILDRLQAAADGSWLAYGRQRTCIGGSSCFLNEQHSSVLLPSRPGAELLGGNARLSSDGRWVFSYSSPNVLMTSASLLDFQTGARVLFNKSVRLNAEPSVGLDGAVLMPTFGGLLLWQNGNTRTLAGVVTAAVMDDAASTVVYQETPSQLRVVDLASNQTWALGAWERDDTAPRLSADGRWVLYLSGMYNGPQVFFSARDGSGWRQLTDEMGGIREAVLSGDGRVAWAVSNNGAVLRLDTIGGTVETRIEPTPMATSITPGAPGSAGEIAGSSLADKQVLIGGRPAPVQLAEPSRLRFQVPWDTPTGDTELALQPAGVYFESAFPYSIQTIAPAVVSQGGCPAGIDCIPPVAFHEDWSSPVTEANPASAGEIVHIYGTGFGPVAPPVPTGAVSPAEPLSYTTTYLEWTWPLESVGAEVLFCGLAPGLTGYYQLDVRLPANVSSTPEVLFVKWVSADGVENFRPFAYIPVAR